MPKKFSFGSGAPAPEVRKELSFMKKNNAPPSMIKAEKKEHGLDGVADPEKMPKAPFKPFPKRAGGNPFAKKKFDDGGPVREGPNENIDDDTRRRAREWLARQTEDKSAAAPARRRRTAPPALRTAPKAPETKPDSDDDDEKYSDWDKPLPRTNTPQELERRASATARAEIPSDPNLKAPAATGGHSTETERNLASLGPPGRVFGTTGRVVAALGKGRGAAASAEKAAGPAIKELDVARKAISGPPPRLSGPPSVPRLPGPSAKAAEVAEETVTAAPKAVEAVKSGARTAAGADRAKQTTENLSSFEKALKALKTSKPKKTKVEEVAEGHGPTPRYMEYRKGGKTACYAKGGAVKYGGGGPGRADGIAKRGRTKCKVY